MDEKKLFQDLFDKIAEEENESLKQEGEISVRDFIEEMRKRNINLSFNQASKKLRELADNGLFTVRTGLDKGRKVSLYKPKEKT